jgi:hypothetical protein
MKSHCSRGHHSHASFRIEVFQSLFGQASIRYQTCSNPRDQPRNGKAQRRGFGNSTKLSKQKGSRNVEEDAELRLFMEERLVPEKHLRESLMSTPAPWQREPTKKPWSKGESTLGNLYRKSVQEDLKSLVHGLRSAASKAQVFEQEFQMTKPTAQRIVDIEPQDSPTHNGKDFYWQRMISDQEHEKFEQEFRTAQPARPKHLRIESDEPPMLRDVFFRHITLDPEYGYRRLSLDLPESPVMRRLRKEKKHKRVPTSEEISNLSSNPWASILASPVRYCQGTGVRLPSDLLVQWSFVRKRSNDLTYLMPAALADMKNLKALNESEVSQSPERSEVEEGPNHDSVSVIPSSSKLMGKTTMLPYRPLIQRLTEKMIRWDTQLTKQGAVQNILSGRVKVAFDEAQHYASDSAERNRTDLASLKWHANVSTTMTGMMRERVLTALESLSILNDSEQTIVPVPVEALETGRMVALAGPSKDEPGSLKYYFRAAEAMPEPGPEVPSRKHAQLIQDLYTGSFLLHVNSTPVIIPDQPAAVLSGLAPNLIPQTISMNNEVRFPVFNLHQMMGISESDRLAKDKIALRCKQVLQSSKILDVPKSLEEGGQSLVQEQDAQKGPAYLLFVSARAPMASMLAKELWQLWRYQGGIFQEKKMTPVIANVPEAKEGGTENLKEEVGENEMGPGQPSILWPEELGIVPISISA